MDNILWSVKEFIGIDNENTEFDRRLVFDINMALMILQQLGVGILDGMSIKTTKETWADFFIDETVEAAKEYVCLKVRSVFDPPTGMAASQALDRILAELEWRLITQMEQVQKVSI